MHVEFLWMFCIAGAGICRPTEAAKREGEHEVWNLAVRENTGNFKGWPLCALQILVVFGLPRVSCFAVDENSLLVLTHGHHNHILPKSSCGRYPKLWVVAWAGSKPCKRSRWRDIAAGFWGDEKSLRLRLHLEHVYSADSSLSLLQRKYAWSCILVVRGCAGVIITAAFHTFQPNPCRNEENYVCPHQLDLNHNFILCFVVVFLFCFVFSGSVDVDSHALMRHTVILRQYNLFPTKLDSSVSPGTFKTVFLQK